MKLAPEPNHDGIAIDSIALKAYERIPDCDTWGVFSYDDGPPAAGGGTGAFLWFDTRDEMLHFIVGYLPLWSAGPCGSDPCQVAARACQILSANGDTTETTRQHLNNVLKGYAQIVWWGKFGQLLSEESDFAREVRSWFRAITADGSEDAPIAPEEAGQFSSAIQEFGI